MNMLRLANNPKAIGGIIISIVGVYWAFKDFRFIEFKESIQQINIIYLVLASFLLWFSVWLRGVRWKCLFQNDNSPSIISLYRAEMIGYFIPNISVRRVSILSIMMSHLINY